MSNVLTNEIEKCRNNIPYFVENYIQHKFAGILVDKVFLYDYQKDIIQKDNFRATAARQIGMSYTAYLRAAYTILFEQDKTILWVAPNQQLCDCAIKAIKEIIDNVNLPEKLKPKIVINNKSQIVYDNGCRIITSNLASYHAGDKIRGSTIHQTYVTEVNFIPRDAWKSFTLSHLPTMAYTPESSIWIWSCLGIYDNINVGFNNIEHISLPFWVTNNETYNLYKTYTKFLSVDELERELLI